jgi:hypothetical protein
MSSDQGMVIAKRSISLSKTYLVMGVFLSLVGLVFLSLPGLIRNVPTTGIPAGANATIAANTAAGVPFLSVPLQALAATMFATPVLLLFVYDKNNGVLEYLLSLGMSQGDIYRQYLKAALILAAAIVAFDVIIDVIFGLIEGAAGLTLEVSGLVAALALAAVSFGTLLMMSFSSLQKQRMGSNQPLGMAIGATVVLPAYMLPLIIPSIAFWTDLLLAGVIIGLALLTYSLSSGLISREKLLP